jgi:hypothetical protein
MMHWAFCPNAFFQFVSAQVLQVAIIVFWTLIIVLDVETAPFAVPKFPGDPCPV